MLSRAARHDHFERHAFALELREELDLAFGEEKRVAECLPAHLVNLSGVDADLPLWLLQLVDKVLAAPRRVWTEPPLLDVEVVQDISPRLRKQWSAVVVPFVLVKAEFPNLVLPRFTAPADTCVV